jgi:transcriptional regulator GlxA family with amidase domain
MMRTLCAVLCTASLAPAAALGATPKKLTPPASEPILVAFVLTEGATMIDFAGPWEVFQDVYIESRGGSHAEHHPFKLYTVSDRTDPIRTSGGMKVVPDYTFATAPPPRIVVVGAQGGRSPAMMAWLRKVASRADVLMSVCTGAFKLGAAGLLDGKEATTHHDYYEEFATTYPRAKLVRSRRFVQSDAVVATAGGLTSGIDLALHVVERYFGRNVAQRTADYMEYEGTGWKR